MIIRYGFFLGQNIGGSPGECKAFVCFVEIMSSYSGPGHCFEENGLFRRGFMGTFPDVCDGDGRYLRLFRVYGAFSRWQAMPRTEKGRRSKI